MKRILTTCAAALALGGCVSLKALPAGPLGRPGPLALSQRSGQPAAGAPEEEADLVCRHEVATGTHIPREVCRTRLEREHERRKAEDLLLLGRQGDLIVY